MKNALRVGVVRHAVQDDPLRRFEMVQKGEADGPKVTVQRPSGLTLRRIGYFRDQVDAGQLDAILVKISRSDGFGLG